MSSAPPPKEPGIVEVPSTEMRQWERIIGSVAEGLGDTPDSRKLLKVQKEMQERLEHSGY